MAQDGPRMVPGWAQDGPGRPKMAKGGAKKAQDGARTAQDGVPGPKKGDRGTASGRIGAMRLGPWRRSARVKIPIGSSIMFGLTRPTQGAAGLKTPGGGSPAAPPVFAPPGEGPPLPTWAPMSDAKFGGLIPPGLPEARALENGVRERFKESLVRNGRRRIDAQKRPYLQTLSVQFSCSIFSKGGSRVGSWGVLGPKMAPRWSQDCPKMAQDGPRWSQHGPGKCPGPIKMARDDP